MLGDRPGCKPGRIFPVLLSSDRPLDGPPLDCACSLTRRATTKILSCVVLLFIGMVDTATVSGSEHDFFESRIRPLLIEHCLECHGPEKQESGLRLDSRTALLKGGDSGSAVTLDRPEASLMIRAIAHTGDLKMPPDGKLSADQVDAFSAWVSSGLPWPQEKNQSSDDAHDPKTHWAFQSLRRPHPPKVHDGGWPTTEIDHFILARLQEQQLAPAPQADPTALIRRASIDLLGLPPTPEQVDAFNQESQVEPKNAWSNLVDRLLSSPHYGERQARFWLDVARYADNKGYVFFEQKEYPWAWTYRDWVVSAMNADMPYDEFVLLQLAADQLETRKPKSLAAMGFLTLGPRFMNNTHDVIDDRIDVVTRGLLGLTVTCARCHDHKFDPVPQADYYSLYGVFRSCVEPTLRPLIREETHSAEYQEFKQGMQQRVDKLHAFVETQRKLMIDESRSRAAEYLMAVYQKRNHPTTENFMLLTEKGAINPTMVHRWEVYLRRAQKSNDPVWTPWHRFSGLSSGDFIQQAAELQAELLVDEKVNRLVRDSFQGEPPRSMQDVADNYASLFAAIETKWDEHLDKNLHPTRLDEDAAEAIRLVLYGDDSPPMVPRDLGWGFLDLLPDRPIQDQFKKLLGEVEEFSTTAPGAPPRAMVLVDAESMYDPVVFRRGNPNREGERVPRQFLEVLSAGRRTPFANGSGRIDLARAIVEPDNPLTARVLVNRIWRQHFGFGLVETPSDFGLRSAPPSHPQLLDFLAAEFIAGGWSIKKLHRQIMNSSVYRQSSLVGDAAQRRAMKVDAANRLLWKFPRRRLEFEAIRDAQLLVCDSLDRRFGGRPVKVLDGYHPRRTLYGFVDRMDLPALMRTFDFPEPAATSPGREVTTIPQQALYFLNHDFVAESARRVLRRPDVAGLPSGKERLLRIHKVLLQREPTTDEVELALAFVSRREELQPNQWEYGYGRVDAETGTVKTFAELTYWTGSRWQAGPKLPDPKLGWLFHDRTGGHPGASPERCFILRWTAPRSGDFQITGMLAHRPEPGNGVRGRMVTRGNGVLGEWKVDQSEQQTNVAKTSLEAGESIHFVVDFQGEILHDEFEWPVVIEDVASGERWDSQQDFRGAVSDAWTNYVHALFMTNEFAFIE